MRALIDVEASSTSSLFSAFSGIKSFMSSGEVALLSDCPNVQALFGVLAEVVTKKDVSVSRE